jgi:hypothetical protein
MMTHHAGLLKWDVTDRVAFQIFFAKDYEPGKFKLES